MEQINNQADMLDLITQPTFCVENGTIVRANQFALQRLVEVGTDVSTLLLTGNEEYAAFEGGNLYLTVSIADHVYGASVTRIGTQDIFLLEAQTQTQELHAMALAAKELREPLANIMAVTDRLLPEIANRQDSHARLQAGQINQGLHQLLRLVSNMSDAARYNTQSVVLKQTCNVSAVLDELLASVSDHVAGTNRTLHFTGLNKPIYCLINQELLERAIYNLISNALKFSAEGAQIHAKLTAKGNKLYFTIEDNGQGVAAEQKNSMFSRFLREPGIEDGRYGIGLGMVLVRAAATAHGGTVLVEHPKDGGTRISLSLVIEQDTGNVLHSNILTVDYSGERDHALIELSDSLPISSYITTN